jgi:hypothetical protein
MTRKHLKAKTARDKTAQGSEHISERLNFLAKPRESLISGFTTSRIPSTLQSSEAKGRHWMQPETAY